MGTKTSKFPPGVVSSFLIKRISLDRGHRSKVVRVFIFDTREALTIHFNMRNPKHKLSFIYGCFNHYISGRIIGDICLLRGNRDLYWTAIHEAFHAGFKLAGIYEFPLKPDRFPSRDYEECVVSSGQYIASRLVEELKSRGLIK